MDDASAADRAEGPRTGGGKAETGLRPIGLIHDSVAAFIADDALSRGASIAFYAVTSMAPVLVIIVAIAGAAFGDDAARGALATQLGGIMGSDSATLIQDIVVHAATHGSGTLAGIIGTLALVVTASGVFGEIQASLNAIWGAAPSGTTLRRLIRARLVSLALVCGLGCILLLSLGISTGLAVLSQTFSGFGTGELWLGQLLNIGVTFLLAALLIAAIYKILPDTEIAWRPALVGAVVTAFLFEIGKVLIGFYLGRVAPNSAYGTAGSLLIILLWTYYSAQIFLLGAEFTKVFAGRQLERRQKQDATR
jgi:membrane protein